MSGGTTRLLEDNDNGVATAEMVVEKRWRHSEWKIIEEMNSNKSKKDDATTTTTKMMITVSVPFLFDVAAISGGFGCLSALVIAVYLGQLPLWPLKNISRYASEHPGVYLFRFCSALCGFCTVAVGTFGYLRQKKRTAFAWCAVLCGIGITGTGLITPEENHTFHLTFAVIFYVSGAILSSLEAVYKKSCPMALSSLLIWISLIGIVVSAAAGGKTGSVLISVFEWTVVVLLFGIILFMGKESKESSLRATTKANNSAAENQINTTVTQEIMVLGTPLLLLDNDDDVEKKEHENNNNKDDDKADEDEDDPVVPTITVSVPFLFNVAAIVGGLGCLSAMVIAVYLGQQPLWPLKNISQYAEKYPGIYLFRFCCALCGFCIVSIGAFGYLTPPAKKKRIVFASFAILCGIGITGAGLVSSHEFNELHLAFAVIFFVSGAVVSSLEAAYKKSCLLVLSSVVIWISLIGIVVITVVEDKGNTVMVSIFEWTVATLLFGLMLFMGKEEKEE